VDKKRVAKQLLALAKELTAADELTVAVILMDNEALHKGTAEVVASKLTPRQYDRLARHKGFKQKKRDTSMMGYYYVNDEGDALVSYPDVYSVGEKVRISKDLTAAKWAGYTNTKADKYLTDIMNGVETGFETLRDDLIELDQNIADGSDDAEDYDLIADSAFGLRNELKELATKAQIASRSMDQLGKALLKAGK